MIPRLIDVPVLGLVLADTFVAMLDDLCKVRHHQPFLHVFPSAFCKREPPWCDTVVQNRMNRFPFDVDEKIVAVVRSPPPIGLALESVTMHPW